MQSTGERVIEAYRDGGALWELTMSGVQPRQLVPIELWSRQMRQHFRVIWATPEDAKAAATKWLENWYGAKDITFWKAPHSLPTEFYAQFTMGDR